MSFLFHVGHIAQLHEIQAARLKRGEPGIAREVEELIARLTSGGVAGRHSSERERQAKVLWDRGYGREIGIGSFEAYLATIPDAPENPRPDLFDRLVLVDRRVTLTVSCRLARLKFTGDDNTFEPYDVKTAKKHGDVYWMWCQDGRKNRDKSIYQCRREFQPGEIGLDAYEFVALYTQDPGVIGKPESPHYIDCSASVLRENRDNTAYGGDWDDDPELLWRSYDCRHPHFGSASRWE